MNTTWLLVAGGCFSLLMIISSLVMMKHLDRQERFAARIKRIHGADGAGQSAPRSMELRKAAVHLMAAVGSAILRRGLLPPATLADFEKTLLASGLSGRQRISVFIGAKIVLMVALPSVVWLIADDLPLPSAIIPLLPMAAAMIGLLLPDKIIREMRKRYIKKLEAAIPDMLDMLVICTQAGLSLGASVLRVAQELRLAYPEAADELERTATDMQLLSDSRAALAMLGSRTGIEALRRLATTMNQSLQYGTPLSDALRTLSTELRQDMLNRFEARAARLPVMMTLPTIVFIMPCVFLVTGGPAVIQMMQAFKH